MIRRWLERRRAREAAERAALVELFRDAVQEEITRSDPLFAAFEGMAASWQRRAEPPPESPGPG